MADILIIEDNPANAELFTYLLGAWGHATRVAPDAERGLAELAARAPDLVLCDIQLPGMSGADFVRKLRADPALASLPVIALTALAMLGDRERLMADGFDDYVAKPIEPASFVEKVTARLGQPHHGTAPAPAWGRPDVRGGSLRSSGARASGEGPAAGADAAGTSACATVRERVLVVDDVPDNLAIIVGCLAPLGYRVRTAATMEDGLRLARAERPELIISDVGMGSGSGFDFLRRAKDDDDLRDVPFVLITSTRWEQSARLRALQLGAVRYLLRPIDSHELIAEVEAVLG
ncbi:response regulator [Derxia gummosa]|uniref:Response regulator n=1 Tax=Derxia gummosa DSM 723 TaxID=1121388 RepID=A0A8B6XAH2_9BURK|nr:response regulator [Derxia gummosa]